MPLASTAHAAHSPGCDTVSPATTTRGPVATKGSATAKATKGSSTTSRFIRYAAGTRAARTAAPSAARWAAYGQSVSRGVATTSRTKPSSETTLRCAGIACTRECPW